jgi:DNA end-binding protein Ku
VKLHAVSVSAEATGIGAIEASDIVKGFEIGEDSDVVIEPEELEELKLESSRSIDLLQFVDAVPAAVARRVS